MKLFIALLTFAAVVGLSLAQNGQSDLDGVEDNSMRIGFCGSKLSDVLILVCRPFGGIARRKRGESSDNPLAALMWHRSTREIHCSKPSQSAICFCCSKFHGPCTLNSLIANFCAQPPQEFDRYFIKS